MPDVAVAVAPKEVARREVEEPRVAGIVRMRRRGPEVAEQAEVVEEALAADATDGREENTSVRIRSLACDKPTIDAIPGRPSGGAIADEG